MQDLVRECRDYNVLLDDGCLLARPTYHGNALSAEIRLVEDGRHRWRVGKNGSRVVGWLWPARLCGFVKQF